MKNYFCLLIISLLFFTTSYSQSPYELKIGKESIIYGTGLTTIVLGRSWSTGSPFFTTDELITLDRNDVNRLDRIAIDNFSERANEASDVLMYSGFAMPYLFLAGKDSRNDIGKIMLLYGEAFCLNSGVTLMSKSLFRRPRPYSFNEEITEEYKLSREAKTSFISGHTSMTAMNFFFAAKVFSDFYPDSKWKPVVWVVAASIPAATGTFRVLAGKHYPTDVIAGYAVGATIGFLIPHIHKKKNVNKAGVHFDVGFGGARLAWRF